jgi:2-amino-4-hydroxy-6-hydroxymethyldihydropteridine diphosphokinase
MIHNVYLALGTNLGDREKELEQAIAYINMLQGTNVKSISRIYETKPVGYTNQADFLNMVICIQTQTEPLQLLIELQEIENRMKRVREIHWGPRTIDIDILLYDNLEINFPKLVIPHPRMFVRAFVLVPLKDIYPYTEVFGKNIDELIYNSEDRQGLKLYC